MRRSRRSSGSTHCCRHAHRSEGVAPLLLQLLLLLVGPLLLLLSVMMVLLEPCHEACLYCWINPP
jgi:hypothetical protein